MDVFTIEIALATACVVTFVAGILFYLVNSGVFMLRPFIGQGTPPVRNLTIMYKIGSGDYKKSGTVFAEVGKLVPDAEMIGIYYDDPNRVPTESLRWAVGAILAEGVEEVDVEVEKTLEDAGFRRHSLPCADIAVQTEWEIGTKLAFWLAFSRVYPALGRYLEDMKVDKAGPCVEIYDGSTMNIMFPLDHHDGFYVPGIDNKKKQ